MRGSGNGADHVWNLAVGPEYIERRTRQRADQNRLDRKKPDEAERRPRFEKAGDEKISVGGKKTAGRWILQSVDVFLIYSFL
ncbi:hypothetical protein TNCT_442891 [Trichonephila clavata]|uniref:Uncharacterized protein n=1 Tax=Trichonephila clavata TaxID=2740835 RepID=A0A8X6L3G5_TRICU|nr:hypothetical protein TNCT_442891 [Trichonephila clavata]